MDLSEKLRHLEETRAARRAKETVLSRRQQVLPVRGADARAAENSTAVNPTRSGKEVGVPPRRSVTDSNPPRGNGSSGDYKGLKSTGRGSSSASFSYCITSKSTVEEGGGIRGRGGQCASPTPSVVTSGIKGSLGASLKVGGGFEAAAGDRMRSGVAPSGASVRCAEDAVTVSGVPTPLERVKLPFSNSTNSQHMNLAYTMRFGVIWGNRSRCVLDVRVLSCPFLQGEVPPKSALFFAVALSEGYTAESFLGGTVQGPPDTSSLKGVESAGLVLLVSVQRGEDGESSVVVPLCFHSEVRALTCSGSYPHLLFGGASSGRILAWRVDQALQHCGTNVSVPIFTRFGEPPSLSNGAVTSRNLPAMIASPGICPDDESFPSPHSHRTRVLAMAVQGDQGSRHLYSISQDGQVCMWEPSKLRWPTSTRESAVHGAPPGCIGSCASFVSTTADAMNKVYFGCLSGHILEGGTKGSRTVDMQTVPNAKANSGKINRETVGYRERYTKEKGNDAPAHCAAVLAVIPHPLHGDSRISSTLLSAAADGSCFLWLGTRCVAIEGLTSQVNCLQWSPTHSAVFVAGESSGRVAAWDLSKSRFPFASVYPSAGSALGTCSSRPSKPPVIVPLGGRAVPPLVNAGVLAEGCAPISSLAFSEDGTCVVCGSSDGEVHVLFLHGDAVREQPIQSYGTETGGEESAVARTATLSDATELLTSSWIDEYFPPVGVGF